VASEAAKEFESLRCEVRGHFDGGTYLVGGCCRESGNWTMCLFTSGLAGFLQN
jgi:hypothetical protein